MLAQTAAQPVIPKLDNYFKGIESRDQASGSFALSKNGQIIYQKAFGNATLNPKQKADTATKCRIGSISKTFTAVILLQMAEEGKLTWENPLSNYFPAWPEARKITIENLLRHQSGIHNFGNDNSAKYQNVNPQTRAEIVAVLKDSKMDFKAGTKTNYNNANYVVLSIIAEELDSLSFGEILQKRIAEPLALQHTFFGNKIQTESNEAQSFYWKKGWQLNSEADLKTLLGAGGIVSTPSDLCRFFDGLFNGKLLAEESLDKMLKFNENLGLGIFGYPFYEKTAYGHAGNIDAFESFAAHFPVENESVALILNGNRKDFNTILKEILDVYFDK